MRLLLLTRAMEPSSEVLPALGLLAHHVRALPAEPTALLDAPNCDALVIDGRRDLPAVRGLTRLIRQTGVDVPVLLVTTEGGLNALASIERKSAQADQMFDSLVAHMLDAAGVARGTTYSTPVEVPSWLAS